MSLLYVDSSSLVKLVAPEPETAALVALLREGHDAVSSALARAEVLRAVSRAGLGRGGLTRARSVLHRVSLVAADDPVLEAAATIEPADIRSLDAIHLATALSLIDDLDGFVCYDRRLARSARALGLEVRAPR